MDAVVEWMRAHPRPDGYELSELAAQFGRAPERMRDQLRRLVDVGVLVQSEPVTGFADNNPRYALAKTPR